MDCHHRTNTAHKTLNPEHTNVIEIFFHYH